MGVREGEGREGGEEEGEKGGEREREREDEIVVSCQIFNNEP